MWNIGYPVNWHAPLNRGLLSWWSRTPTLISNARWLDLCGKSHGALVGAPVWSGASRPGGWGSLLFDGSDDHVSLANPTRFELGVANWTATMWIKPTNNTADRMLLSKTAAGSWDSAAKGWYLAITTGKQVLDCNPVGLLTSTTAVPLGVWSHVACTFTDSSNAVVFYLNGRADGSGTLNLNADNAAHVLKIGASGTAVPIPFFGLSDDLRFYTQVVPAGEILRLYQASRTGYKQELNWLDDEDVGLRRWMPPPRQYYQAVNRAARY